ncbi:MAG: leucine-rich repeat protein, partial [Clostridia bacterium]|nr:leucine-rich repeat protein [Clostridia bacterium]
RIYLDCVGKKEFLNTAAEGEEPNGDTYVAAKLTIDKQVEPGKAKFALSYQGAGIYSSPGVSKKAGYVTLCVSAHSILIDQSDDYYSNIKSVLPTDYLRRQKFNDNAEISYKKYIFLRDLQAVRFLKEFFGENGGGQGTVDGVDTSAWAGLWDGTTIEVSGSSQGGWQSLAVAALDHDITKMTANVPGMSDIYSGVYEPGRDFYDSGYYHYSQKYFDGVSLAKRIVCDSYIRTGLGDKTCPASIVICVYNALNTKKELTIWQCMPHSQGKTYADGTAKPSWTYSENFKLGYSDSLTFDFDVASISGNAVSLGADGKTITADNIGEAVVSFENGFPSITLEVVPAVLNIAITNGISGDTSDFEDGLDIAFSNRRDELIRIAEDWDDFASENSEGKYIKGESYYFLMDDGNGSFPTRSAAAQALKAAFTASGADYCAMIAEPSLGVTSSAMYAMQLMPKDYPDMYVVGKSDADLVSVGRASGNAILSIVDANQPYDENVIDVYNTATGRVMNTFDTIAEGEDCPIAIVPSQPHSIRDGIEYSVEGLNISDMLVITGDSNGGKIVVNSKEYIITNSCVDFGTADNFSWILDNDYNLIISGKAIDASFDYLAYADKIKTVTLEEGITEVASGAFAGLTALESIKLPHSLETVADDAISASADLEIIAYENNESAIQLALACGTSITSLGLSFDAGDDLMAVLKDGTLTITGTGTVVNSGCTASYGSWTKSAWYDYYSQITKIVIKAPVTTLAGGCFTYIKNLKTVEIPKTLNNISGYSFGFCYGLNTIYIGGSETVEGTLDLRNVTSIGTYAFTICRNFDRVIFSDELKSISSYAFSSDSDFAVVEIPESVTYIGSNAFSHSQTNAPGIKTVFIKGNVDIASSDAFKDIAGTRIICATEYTYNMLKSFAYENIELFYAEGLKEYGIEDGFFWIIDKNYQLSITPSGDITYAACPWEEYKTSIKSVAVGDGATVIDSAVFSGLTALEKVTLPYTLTSVSTDAFEGCSGFTLYGYESNEATMALVSANENITFVSLGAFGNAGTDLQWKYSDGVLEIFGTGTTVNPGTTGYGSWVNSSFYPYFNKITKVIIGPSVTTVYNDAFANMDALLTVEIPAGLTKLNYEAFAYCDKLNTIYISGNEPIEGTFDLSNITSFNNYALHFCPSVKNVILGNITTISTHAFSRCASLETVTVNNTNTVEVMANAFYSSASINKSMKTVIFKGPMTATATSFSDVAMNIYVASAEDAEAFNALGYVNAKAVFLTDASSAIAHEGFAVRIEGYNGLRSFFSFDNSVLKANKMGGNELVEYGAILASRENYEKYGVALISDGENYITANSKIVKKAVFKGETQVGKTLSTSDDDFVRFAATVTNFSSNYTSDIYFCGYEIWKTADGTEKIFYTDCADDDYDLTNIYRVSLNTYKNGLVNAQNDKESIVWNILSEAGAVTLNAGTDYTLTDGLTDLDGNPFGDTFVFRDVIAATQSSSTSTKLLEFGKGTSRITLLSDPAGGYIAVYRPVGETGSVPSIAGSAYNAGRGNQLHSNFGTNYTHNSIAYTVDTARPNPTVSSDIYKNIHTVILDYGITSIGKGAFANNGYATTYIYPTSLTTLSSHVFYGASGITTMFRADPENPGEIENGLVDISMISSVGTSYLFTKCINIVKLHLPGNLTKIETTFISVVSSTSSALQKIWCGDKTEPENGTIDLTGANITTIGSIAFKGVINISTVKLPNTCTTIDAKAFYDRTSTATMESLKTIVQETKVDAIATYCGTIVSYVDFDGKAH